MLNEPEPAAAATPDARGDAGTDTGTPSTDIAWARLSPLLDQALDLPAAGRGTWLDALRARAPADAQAVERLLAHHDSAGREGFLQASAAMAVPGVAARQRRFGPWAVEEQLGEGGMGSVWLARRSDGRFDGQAAIKLMHGRLHGSQAMQRFEREGRILARLEHPHIARLLDAGVAEDGQPYLVLELVRGQAIDRWCDGQRLGVEARLRLFVDVAEAVAAAHAQLVVHRDLKPGNVMVDGQGQVKLLDFGIAKLIESEGDTAGGGGTAADAQDALTRTGQRAFTPGWAAPEQVRGEPIGTAADVWSLGVLLCLLLTGRHPSGLPWGSDVATWLRATAEARTLRPSRLVGNDDAAAEQAERRATTPERLTRRLQGELDQIVQRALADEPGRRYASALALADDVRRHLRHEPVTAHADTLGYRAAKFARRNRLVVGAASTTLLALVAGVLGTTWQALEAQRQRDAARGAQAESVAQATRADEQRSQALANASEAARQGAAAEAARERAVTEAARAEAEAQRAEAESRRAITAQALAQSEATAARNARAETEAQLAQTRAQRTEARYMARASAASADVLSALLADIGAGGKPLSPVELLERGRELVDKNYAADPALQSELLVNLAVRYQLINRPDRELELRALGEQAARRAGDANLLASALCAGISADIDAGRVAVAQARVDEARRVIATMKGEPRLAVRHVCLNAEADLATARRDHVGAVRASQQAVALFEDNDARDGNPYLVALNNLAYHHQRAGQLPPAFEIIVKLGQAMDANGRTTTRDRLVVISNEGNLRVQFGELLQADATFRDAVQRAQGADLTVPATDAGLARAYGISQFHMARDADAVRWLSYARDRGREGRNLFVEREAGLYLARTHLQAGRLSDAEAALDASEAARAAAPKPSAPSAPPTPTTSSTPPRGPEPDLDRVRAQIALQRGDAAQAQQIMQAQLQAIDPAGTRADRDLLAALPIAAQAALVAGAPDEARRHADGFMQRALRVARLSEHSAHVGRAWALLGDVQQRQGQPREALASWQRALPILRVSLGPEHPEVLQLRALLAAQPR